MENSPDSIKIEFSETIGASDACQGNEGILRHIKPTKISYIHLITHNGQWLATLRSTKISIVKPTASRIRIPGILLYAVHNRQNKVTGVLVCCKESRETPTGQKYVIEECTSITKCPLPCGNLSVVAYKPLKDEKEPQIAKWLLFE